MSVLIFSQNKDHPSELNKYKVFKKDNLNNFVILLL